MDFLCEFLDVRAQEPDALEVGLLNKNDGDFTVGQHFVLKGGAIIVLVGDFKSPVVFDNLLEFAGRPKLGVIHTRLLVHAIGTLGGAPRLRKILTRRYSIKSEWEFLLSPKDKVRANG